MSRRCKNTCRTRFWYGLRLEKFIFNEIREKDFHKNDFFTWFFQNVKYVCSFRSKYFFTLYNLKTTEFLTYSLKKSKNLFFENFVFLYFYIFFIFWWFWPQRLTSRMTRETLLCMSYVVASLLAFIHCEGASVRRPGQCPAKPQLKARAVIRYVMTHT